MDNIWSQMQTAKAAIRQLHGDVSTLQDALLREALDEEEDWSP